MLWNFNIKYSLRGKGSWYIHTTRTQYTIYIHIDSYTYTLICTPCVCIYMAAIFPRWQTEVNSKWIWKFSIYISYNSDLNICNNFYTFKKIICCRNSTMAENHWLWILFQALQEITFWAVANYFVCLLSSFSFFLSFLNL